MMRLGVCLGDALFRSVFRAVARCHFCLVDGMLATCRFLFCVPSCGEMSFLLGGWDAGNMP